MRRSSRREYWRRLLARQAASGLSIKAFCVRERVSYPSFIFWKRRCGDAPGGGGGATSPMTFAPVTVVGAGPAQAGRIEILLAGACRVRLTGPVDRQQLIQVLDLLESRAQAQKQQEAAAC